MRTSYLNWRSSGIWDWATWAHVSFLLSLFFAVAVSYTGLLVTSPVLGFLPVQLPPKEHLVFRRVRPLLCMASSLWGWEEVVSARLNPTNGTIDVRGVCNFPGSILSQQKFEVTYGPALQPLVRPVLQLRVTAPFYLESKRKYILEAWGHADPKDVKRREAPLFVCFLSSPWACPM